MTPINVSFTALQSGELVTGVEWTAHAAWWGAQSLPRPPVRSVFTPTNLNSAAVRSGLEAGTIHVAVGAATLSPTDFTALRESSGAKGAPQALVSDPLQTRILLLNSNATAPANAALAGPLQSLAVRRAVNAAIDKAGLVTALRSLETAADRLFATDTPYANTPIGTLPVFDVDNARNLLQQDGWLIPSGSTFRQRGSVLLAGQLIYVASDASAAAIGE
jgi:ABC-type transport system substrate-binding protein